MNGKRLQIELPDDLQAEAVFGGGSEICGPKQNYFFRVIPWRDLKRNYLGNYLLGLKNIIPARNFSNSSYLLRSEN